MLLCLLSNRALLVRTESPPSVGIGSCPVSYVSIGDAFLSILATDTPCDWVISIPPGWSGQYNNLGEKPSQLLVSDQLLQAL